MLLRRAEIARRTLENVRYYDEARKLARLISINAQGSGKLNHVVSVGGWPGVMEAANRAAHDFGAKSVDLNIVLPHEHSPNPYINPELSLQFHYFAVRKMHFLDAD